MIFFRKFVDKIQVCLNLSGIKLFTWRRMYSYVQLWHLFEFFLEWQIFEIEIVEKIKPRFMISHLMVSHFMVNHLMVSHFMVNHLKVSHFMVNHLMVSHFMVNHLKVSHFMVSQSLFPANRAFLWINFEKCGNTRQATEGNVIWSIGFACWITMDTHTHTHTHTHTQNI